MKKDEGKKPANVRIMEDILSSKTNIKTVYTSGIIEGGVFFQTVFFQYKGRYQPFIITSKGDIIKVEREEHQFFKYDGKTYKFRAELFFDDTCGINTVDKKVVSLITDRKFSTDIYKDLREAVCDYFDHYNPIEYDIVTALSIQTYIKWALGRTFYYILHGDANTGKTTLQILISLLELNGKFTGKGTVPVSSRLVHFLGANINLDEFDKLGDKERMEFTAAANTGFYSNGTYEFVNVNKKNINDQITVLNTFSTRTFSTNSLYGFDKAFLSRCYICTATRKNRQTKDIHKLPETEIQRFQDLRNRTFAYCIFNWNKILKDIEDVERELEAEGVFGRVADTNSIILGIVRHFGGDFGAVKDELKRREGMEEDEKGDTDEAIIFEYLVKRFNELKSKETIEVPNKEIYNYWLSEKGISSGDEHKPNSSRIGWVLKKSGLLRRSGDTSRKAGRGNVIYVIHRSEFADMLARFGYTELREKLPQDQTAPSPSSRSSQQSEDSEKSEDVKVRLWGIKNGILSLFSKTEQITYAKLEEKVLEKYGQDELIELPDLLKRLLKGGIVYEVESGKYMRLN